MILLVHNGNTVDEVYSPMDNIAIDFNPNEPIISVLKKVSKTFPDELLIWVKSDYKSQLNYDEMKSIFNHKCIMASYPVIGTYCISPRIGYVEQTPFTNISREISFPTWFMSSDVGGIFAEIFNRIVDTVSFNKNSDYFLTSLGKHNMPLGLFCYSNPKFLKQIPIENNNQKESIFLLFKFVKQHYKSVWVFNLFMCFVLFEKRFPIFPFLNALFFKRNSIKKYLNPLDYKSTKSAELNQTLDVIIPTIGRKGHLYDILKDLSEQTILPQNVIIVEQSASKPPISELDYVTNQVWPFNIIHKFASNTGVCKARNIAMEYVENDWCFFADDDIRIEQNFIEDAFKTIDILGVEILNMLCLQPHEKQSYFYVSQTDIFGSGTSIVKTSFFNKVAFDTSFEFGFGEDSDFGMQLRKAGGDVMYVPTIKITHLKAPIGGFRNKHVTKWENESMQPKPSPTFMVFIKKHYNTFQINGYKYTLFLKFYRKQTIKNPFKYLKTMQKQWKQSEYWAGKLMSNEN
jgi:GT2 family glycosyltransferase